MAAYKVGLVGATADIASAHLDAISHHQDFELLGVCDLNAEKLADRYLNQNLIITRDYKILLNNTAIDTIVICTPNHLHAPIAIDALKAQKHVLCEKPMTINPKQAKELKEAQKMSQGVFVVSYHFEFFPEVQYFKTIKNTFAPLKRFRFESSEHLFPGKSWNFEKYNGGVWLDWAPNALSALRQVLTYNGQFKEFKIHKAELSSSFKHDIETKALVELALDNYQGKLLIDWEAHEHDFIARTTLWDENNTEIILDHAHNTLSVNGTQTWYGNDSRYREVYKDFAHRIKLKSSNLDAGIFESNLIEAVFIHSKW